MKNVGSKLCVGFIRVISEHFISVDIVLTCVVRKVHIYFAGGMQRKTCIYTADISVVVNRVRSYKNCPVHGSGLPGINSEPEYRTNR
jgi:hypothetical protein